MKVCKKHKSIKYIIASLLIVFIIIDVFFMVHIIDYKFKDIDPPIHLVSSPFMGSILSPKSIDYSAIIYNSGSEPLHIIRYKPSCGCTTVSTEQFLLKAYSYHNINIHYNSIGKEGRQKIILSLWIEGYNKPITILLFANVIVQCPKYLYFPAMLCSNIIQENIIIYHNPKFRNILIKKNNL